MSTGLAARRCRRAGRPRPTAPSGTIEFRSASLLSRYIGADLRLTDDGYFVTGDIGLMDDGELFVIGRGDEVIVVAGRNLYPADIEAAVQHESIRGGLHRGGRGARRRARDRGRAERVERRRRRARGGVPRHPHDGREPDRLRAGHRRVRPARLVAEDAERQAPPPRDPQGARRPTTASSPERTSDDGVLRRPRSPTLLRAELAAVTGRAGRPSSRDDALLGDVGVDSLALIEALLSVRDQILEDLGLSVDDVDEPPTLPWIETVGELIAYVRSSIPATVTEE